MYRESWRQHRVGIVALLCIFIGLPLATSVHGMAIVALAGIAAGGVLLWRPLQAWAARLEAEAARPDSASVEQRLRQLEELVAALSTQQRQLQETIHWQAQLLQRSVEEPAAKPH